MAKQKIQSDLEVDGSLKITDVNKLVTEIGNVNIFTTNSQGANLGGSITLGGSFNNLSPLPFASIAGRKLNSANSDAAGYLQFNTRQNSGLAERARIDQNGKLLIGVTFSSSSSLLQVNSTVEASPATASTHLVTKAQLDTKQDSLSSGTNIKTINGSSVLGSGDLVVNTALPYKVYTALLSQSGTNDPTVTVLQNTFASYFSWVRTSTGVYTGTLTNAFSTANKNYVSLTQNYNEKQGIEVGSSNTAIIRTSEAGTSPLPGDSSLTNTPVEIRVYN
jgi:hypothetical protein